jgi:hypothetical protein
MIVVRPCRTHCSVFMGEQCSLSASQTFGTTMMPKILCKPFSSRPLPRHPVCETHHVRDPGCCRSRVESVPTFIGGRNE